MAGRVRLGQNVFVMAVERTRAVYREGHRVVVSFSAGKDSGVALEIAIMAATLEDKLPVEVTMRDEEMAFPGTFEYAERVAARPEVKFHWIVQRHPILNLYNRRMPYVWTFDTRLSPDQWVRQYPSWATHVEEQAIPFICSTRLFPPPEGKKLMNIMGLRAAESGRRLMGIHSSGSYVTKEPGPAGSYSVRPIYDWTDDDVWLAVSKFGWDYNRAYDVMHKLGIPKRMLRIAPPTMNPKGWQSLTLARKAWPDWFDKVCDRCPGVEQAALFGPRWIEPNHKHGESWEATFRRECIDDAPPWIANRSREVMAQFLRRHGYHTSAPFPEIVPCLECAGGSASWKKMADSMYNGDPFSVGAAKTLPFIEPNFFRPELTGQAATWGGHKPTF